MFAGPSPSFNSQSRVGTRVHPEAEGRPAPRRSEPALQAQSVESASAMRGERGKTGAATPPCEIMGKARKARHCTSFGPALTMGSFSAMMPSRRATSV